MGKRLIGTQAMKAAGDTVTGTCLNCGKENSISFETLMEKRTVGEIIMQYKCKSCTAEILLKYDISVAEIVV